MTTMFDFCSSKYILEKQNVTCFNQHDKEMFVITCQLLVFLLTVNHEEGVHMKHMKSYKIADCRT